MAASLIGGAALTGAAQEAAVGAATQSAAAGAGGSNIWGSLIGSGGGGGGGGAEFAQSPLLPTGPGPSPIPPQPGAPMGGRSVQEQAIVALQQIALGPQLPLPDPVSGSGSPRVSISPPRMGGPDALAAGISDGAPGGGYPIEPLPELAPTRVAPISQNPAAPTQQEQPIGRGAPSSSGVIPAGTAANLGLIGATQADPNTGPAAFGSDFKGFINTDPVSNRAEVQSELARTPSEDAIRRSNLQRDATAKTEAEAPLGIFSDPNLTGGRKFIELLALANGEYGGLPTRKPAQTQAEKASFLKTAMELQHIGKNFKAQRLALPPDKRDDFVERKLDALSAKTGIPRDDGIMLAIEGDIIADFDVPDFAELSRDDSPEAAPFQNILQNGTQDQTISMANDESYRDYQRRRSNRNSIANGGHAKIREAKTYLETHGNAGGKPFLNPEKQITEAEWLDAKRFLPLNLATTSEEDYLLFNDIGTAERFGVVPDKRSEARLDAKDAGVAAAEAATEMHEAGFKNEADQFSGGVVDPILGPGQFNTSTGKFSGVSKSGSGSGDKDGATLPAVLALKKDFQMQSQDYIKLMDAYSKASASRDLYLAGGVGAKQAWQALNVTFQKSIDPPSVVRESEFSRTEEFQSLIGKVENAISKGLRGEASPELVEDVFRNIEVLKEAMQDGQRVRKENYEKIATGYNIPPNFITGAVEAPDKKFTFDSETGDYWEE